MNHFADSVAELRYERGIVSFRLHCSTSSDRGIVVHIPFEDYRHISDLFGKECAAIGLVHANWITEQSVSGTTHNAPDPRTDTAPALGRKIGSV